MEQAVEKGNFGPGPRTIIRKIEENEIGAQFASSLEFFKVKCCDKEFKVVCKIPPKNEYARSMLRSDLQFLTEVAMYKEVIPYFGVQDLFPVMYYGQAEGNHETDIVLLEDMSEDGFKITNEKLFLSIDHLRLAIKALGRFHAASLKAKATENNVFEKLVSHLKYEPVRWDPEDDSVQQYMARGIKPLLEKYVDVLQPTLKITQDINFLKKITKPREPWNVICHGDFCRNNMMFKYEGDKPVAIKLFDLQTSRYTSPAIDISFFLYLNTDKATRDLYWDSLLNDYLVSLKTHLPSDITIDEQCFYDDFASRAIYGYFHCSFFTPMMSVDNPPDMEDFGKFTVEERVQNMISMGGERGTQLIADIVEHLVKKGYIKKMLEFVKSK